MYHRNLILVANKPFTKILLSHSLLQALDGSGGLRGARCCILKPNPKISVEYKPILNITKYSSFYFVGSGKMKVQMAYGIGSKVGISVVLICIQGVKGGSCHYFIDNRDNQIRQDPSHEPISHRPLHRLCWGCQKHLPASEGQRVYKPLFGHVSFTATQTLPFDLNHQMLCSFRSCPVENWDVIQLCRVCNR